MAAEARHIIIVSEWHGPVAAYGPFATDDDALAFDLTLEDTQMATYEELEAPQ